MTTDIDGDLVGAHMSALLSLRSRSLAAYGVDPHALTLTESRALMDMPGSKTRALAKISRGSRALAVESEHALVAL
jgi:hypothetical protein